MPEYIVCKVKVDEICVSTASICLASYVMSIGYLLHMKISILITSDEEKKKELPFNRDTQAFLPSRYSAYRSSPA